MGVSASSRVPGDDAVLAWQTSATPVEQEYTAGWVQDTLTSGNWTVNAGLRYDEQKGKNRRRPWAPTRSSRILADKVFTATMPAASPGRPSPRASA